MKTLTLMIKIFFISILVLFIAEASENYDMVLEKHDIELDEQKYRMDIEAYEVIEKRVLGEEKSKVNLLKTRGGSISNTILNQLDMGKLEHEDSDSFTLKLKTQDGTVTYGFGKNAFCPNDSCIQQPIACSLCCELDASCCSQCLE